MAEPRIAQNLSLGCKEIVEEKEEASKSQQDFYQAEEAPAEDAHQKTEQSEQQPDLDVDPDDPLFGLE